MPSESESHSVMSDSLQPPWTYSPWNSPGQNTGVGNLSLPQGIFPSQRLNPGLPHCRQILYQLNHQGSPGSQQIFLPNLGQGKLDSRGDTGRVFIPVKWKWYCSYCSFVLSFFLFFFFLHCLPLQVIAEYWLQFLIQYSRSLLVFKFS